jgi:di/tricarboxylate transporter
MMSIPQIEAVGIVLGMLGLFVWDRLRYDLVALLALLAAVLLRVVPADHAFTGFSNPVVVIIGAALVVGRAITRSGVIDALLQHVLRRLSSPSAEIGVLSGCVALLSAFLKNVGTLGIFMPIAIRVARRRGLPNAAYLMPLSFASLIGGTITLIGTSPNLLISTIRQQTTGHPFRLFDFVPVGLPLTAVALVFLTFGWRLTPRDRQGKPAAEDKFEIGNYQTELRVAEESPLIGKTVEDLEQLGDGDLTLTGIIREGGRRYIPSRHWQLFAKDILLIQADPQLVKEIVDQMQLELLPADEPVAGETGSDSLETMEAVVLPDSPLVGKTVAAAHLRQHYEVNLLALGTGTQRAGTRLRRHRFRPWDIILLQGRPAALTDSLTALQCLPLADRGLALGLPRGSIWPIVILAGSLTLAAFGLMPVAIAFLAAAVLVTVLRRISLKEAYEAVDWPVIVLLGALIPVGESLHGTGADVVLAGLLADIGGNLPGPAALAMVLAVAMLLTPLLHHAAAVLVMGPVAATLAARLGYNADPFLMAVALGASCDFLTPIGHQNNALIMAPGGYRFSDYWRLGLPLSLLVVAFGTPLILWSWPL